MREYGFIIIKPTKAENFSINNLRLDLGLHRNTCLQLLYTQNDYQLEKMAELDVFVVLATCPATLGRVWRSRVSFFTGTQNYKVVVPFVGFPKHLESHQSEFVRVRYV